MSYALHQISSNFRIPAGKMGAALDALKQLEGSETCGCAGQKHFMWINNSSEFLGAASLGEALQLWRWAVIPDENDGIADLEFVGENLGDEDLLFKALAPFVKEASSIVVVGEDAAIWRWYFSNGGVQKQAGHLSFSDISDRDR